MSILDDYMDPPADDPALADGRRAWLRRHPTWTINGDRYVSCLLDTVGREWEALANYPGPLWLSALDAQLNAETLVRIGGLPGLTGLQLWDSNVDDAEFIHFIGIACHLAHLTLGNPAGITGEGLGHLKELPNLESLGLFFRNGPSSDTAFLEGLAGERSPRVFAFDSANAFTDSDLDRMAGWSNLEGCSLSLAAGVRDDFPWLLGMEKMRCLELYCDGPLTLAGLARLGGLGALSKLELHTDDSLAPEGLRHLAALENLAELTLYAKKGIHAASTAFAGCKNLLSLNIGASDGSEEMEITTADLVNFTSPSLKETDFHFLAKNPTDSDLEKLPGIQGLAKLELWGNDYTVRGLASLAALPNLTKLELCGFEKLDESDLACLADFPALTGLTLDFQGYGGLAMRRFSFLGTIGKLKSLSVKERGEWNAAMIEDIAAATGLKSLTLYGLWNLPAAWLEAFKQLPALEEVVLDHCLGLRNVDFLREVGTLRRITLRNCDNISVKGLLNLCHLPLEKINVGQLRHFTPVSSQEFVALRLAWPEARVY